MDVHLLWHVSHARNVDGSDVVHRSANGDVLVDDDFDDVKLLGVYRSTDAVVAAISRARIRPGFSEEPECFMTDIHALDEDQWTSGFVTAPMASD